MIHDERNGNNADSRDRADNGDDGAQVEAVVGETAAGDAGTHSDGAEAMTPDDEATEVADSLHADDDDAAADLTNVSPEIAMADSLQSAMLHLRENADKLAGMPLDDKRVSAAEDIAEQAAQLDEQIGSIARKDEN